MKNASLEFVDELIVRSPMYPYKNVNCQEDVLALLDDNFFLEALYVASPLLYDECRKLREGALKTTREQTKVLNSLNRYLSRMRTRSTPFGLFSTCGMAVWADHGFTETGAGAPISRHTRLDMHVLYNLISSLIQEPDIQQQLKYFPNNSRYLIGNEIRYIEYTYKNGRRKYKISGVTFNQYVEKVLFLSQAGLTREELSALLTGEGISEEQSKGFVANIIDAQLLVSDFEVALTSEDDFAQQIHATLSRFYAISGSEPIKRALDFFAGILADLKELDRHQVNGIEAYRSIIEKLKAYYPAVKEEKAFHIDAYRPAAPLAVNATHQPELLHLLQYLTQINAGAYDTEEAIESFKKAFLQRYESQTKRLVEVLDADSGIGYPVNKRTGAAILVDDIPFASRAQESTVTLTPKDKWLLSILTAPTNKDARVIDLAEQPAPGYLNAHKFNGIPTSCSVMFRLTNQEKETLFLEAFYGPSGGAMLSRFAHGNQEIRRVIERIAATEERLVENCVLAEIVHMPNNRITNIIKHPAVRKYEIPYLAKSSVEGPNIIELNDLFVKVENNEVVLFSKRLNKRIVPCKTHMHNHFTNALPLYHFLGDLQKQGVSQNQSINFNWGGLPVLFPYLPRVCYKKIIVAPASWVLSVADLAPLNQGAEQLPRAVAEFREKFNLPRQVLHSEDDNELLVDFSSVPSVETWLTLIKNRPSILLKEFLWAAEADESTHLRQYIATIINTEKRSFADPEATGRATEEPLITREFPVGSEWLYLKLYCGPGSVDMVLAKLLAPVAELLARDGLIAEWFYIKYRDPDFHLRLRLRLKNASDALRVLGVIKQCLANSTLHALVWKMQLDTYSREIERYGANTMALCETIFWVDSKFAVRLLGAFLEDKTEVMKSLWSLRLTDEVFTACGFTLEQKREFVEIARKSFQSEFGTNKRSMESINAKYSAYKDLIKDIMGGQIEDKFPKIAPAITAKMMELAPLLQEIVRLQKADALQTDCFRLLSSIIHMMLNRLITQKERVHELLIYEFLSKHYTTQHFIARSAKPLSL
ncbi:lantibiotic dehydratase [Hymenobacter glaciei]|uniref:Lantibiotic dehydratase n=1 Tax=Hymenobacter glaciei TaxID=877209 RepID=A0ABP7UB66_9BACT